MSSKKSYDSKFKSRVALEALHGDLIIAEIARKYQIHPNLLQQWKKKLQESACDVFMTKIEELQRLNIQISMDG